MVITDQTPPGFCAEPIFSHAKYSWFEKWPSPSYAQFLKIPPSRMLKPYLYIQINSQTFLSTKCLWPGVYSVCLLKANLSSLAPVIVDIVKVSIATGVSPSAFKKALVTPLLKETMLDANDVKNYRPVSNLCIVSKITEKVFAVRFSKHFTDNNLFELMQSAYRPNHSIETALLRVRNDLLCILDERKAAILVLLDLLAAFNTIDHTIMLTCLRDRFGITATCLAWFQSYLANWCQRIQHAQHICRVAYFHLHFIGNIGNLLDRKTTEIMIHTYVTSRLDNGNCLISDHLITILQRV